MFDKISSRRRSTESDGPSIKGKLRALVLGSTPATPASDTASYTESPRWSSSSSSGPPQVAWLRGSSRLPPTRGAQPIGRSVSSQSLPSQPAASPAPRTKLHAQHAMKSTHSLRLDPRLFVASWDDPYSHPGVKQLSPIAEQDYLSPERRSLPLPSDQLTSSHATTPDGSIITRPSPVYSTFLTRPLNRSISQNSSITHISTASAPPALDIRSSSSVRGAKALHVRPMPTIYGSTDGHASNPFDDASSVLAESFITADSLYSPIGRARSRDATEPEYSVEELGDAHSSHSSLGVQIPRTVCDGLAHDNDSHVRLENGSQVRLESVHSGIISQPRTSQATTSSSFFDRRWRRSEHYGTGMTSFPRFRKPRFGESITPACWMFWLGFVFPWCWIIGGWYYTIRGENRPKKMAWKGKGKGKGEKKHFALPLWIKEKKSMEGTRLSEKEAALHGIRFGYPFVAPSVRSLPLTAVRTNAYGSPSVLDPWIFRCRIAAWLCAVLVIVAFVIAFIVVGRKYG